MNRKRREPVSPVWAAAALAFLAVRGWCAGQGSVSYLVIADVFTQAEAGAVVQSATYRASTSVGQRSIVARPVSGGRFTLTSGYQAATDSLSGAAPDPYDTWAVASGLPEGSRGRDDDYDGDGFSNWAEYVANTDPTRKDSVFHVVEVSQNGTQVAVAFTGSADRVYELWFTTDLAEGTWTRVAGPRAGAGGPDTLSHTHEGPSGFFRLKVGLP